MESPWLVPVRHGGILAPHARWWTLVIPPPPPEAATGPEAVDACHSLPMAKHTKPRPATHRCGYIPWHVLMRQLGIDVETCPRCGGKMKIVALVQDPQSIARYLRHLGLPTEADHGSRPWTTVLAEPCPAPPLRRAARRGPSVGGIETVEATPFAVRRRTGPPLP
jgi:hypothetical protein